MTRALFRQISRWEVLLPFARYCTFTKPALLSPTNHHHTCDRSTERERECAPWHTQVELMHVTKSSITAAPASKDKDAMLPHQDRRVARSGKWPWANHCHFLPSHSRCAPFCTEGTESRSKERVKTLGGGVYRDQESSSR
jgi:hypothetical protein